jgi:tRNA (guanine10-N2)-methyltransferase
MPPSRPYELVNLTLDLVHLARYLLVPKGRLVFFLPTVTEDFKPVDVPVVEGMRELKFGDGSVQQFGKWGRRVGPVHYCQSHPFASCTHSQLITMEKTAEDDGPPPTFDDQEELPEITEGNLPGHHQFRDRVSSSSKQFSLG